MSESRHLFSPAPGHMPWADMPLGQRVRRVCALRHALAENPQAFINAIRTPSRRTPVETISSELIPLADACLFLERNAHKTLRPRKLGASGRPAWLWGVQAEIRREPLGLVLIIGPANYPLMLPGIQAVQALVAGNSVLLKPAPGTREVALLLARALHAAGVPEDAFQVLHESPEVIKPWIGMVDKVVLTGSERTGREVMRDLAETLTPSVMELSGCDAVFVLPDADLDLAASCLHFGLTFNGSATCIAPRRVFVHQDIADGLAARLANHLRNVPPLPFTSGAREMIDERGIEAMAQGAKLISGRLPCPLFSEPLVFDFTQPSMRLMQEEIAAPALSLMRVGNLQEALQANECCGYSLGAAVFGPVPAAARLAAQIPAGTIVINDIIAPTADPRLPFGGRGRSGFGVTRGAEGLLAMTRTKTISVRQHGPRMHLKPHNRGTAAILEGYLRAAHGRGWRRRLRGVLQLLSAARRPSPEPSPIKEPHHVV